MSGLAEAEAFKKNLWFYGFDSKMAGAWLSPNGAAMMRVMAMGSTSIVAFDLSELMEIMPKPDEVTFKDVSDYVLALTDPQNHPTKGCIGHAVTVHQDDVIFVPQGWILAELGNPTASLIYGIRKSFMIKSAKSLESYKSCVKLLKQSDRDATKMEEVLKWFSPPAAPAEPVQQAVQQGEAGEAKRE